MHSTECFQLTLMMSFWPNGPYHLIKGPHQEICTLEMISCFLTIYLKIINASIISNYNGVPMME